MMSFRSAEMSFSPSSEGFPGRKLHQPRADGDAIAKEHLDFFRANNFPQGHLQDEM